jgi:ABC-type uncharacterized transport system permease subunit
MSTTDILSFIIIAVYTLGTICIFGGAMSRRAGLKRVGAIAATIGFGLHSLDLVVVAVANPSLTQGAFHISLLAWAVLAIYFFCWYKLRLFFLALTASPLALLIFVASLAFEGVEVKMPKALSGLFFGLHIGSLFVSMALLAMAAGAALFYLSMEKRIKTKQGLKNYQKDMPSLSTFDRVNHWAVVVGFPLYTVGLVSGFIWARFTWGKFITWDPKEIVAFFIWFLYAFLFHQRLALGWRGRKTATMVLWLFGLMVVSMIVVNLFLPTHHTFTPNQTPIQ